MFLSTSSLVKASSLCLSGSHSALTLPPLVALTLLKQQTEHREWEGANLFQQREGGRVGLAEGVGGGVWTCPSHGWSDSPCAGLHIWKRSCHREGDVKANEQEEQRCYICTSSSQRGRGVIFSNTLWRGWDGCCSHLKQGGILEKDTTTSSMSV